MPFLRFFTADRAGPFDVDRNFLPNEALDLCSTNQRNNDRQIYLRRINLS